MSQFPNKKATVTEKRARSVEDAVAEALAELGIAEAEAEIEIIREPSKGLFGFGGKEAVVKVSVKGGAAEEITAEQTAEAEEEPAQSEEEAEAAPEKKEIPADAVNTAVDFITRILSAMGLEVNVSAKIEEDVIKINLEGENMGIVIGKRGDTLDSLQYLTSLVVNRHSEDYIKVSIDTENYRAKRAETLVALSNKLAARVAKTGKKFPLEEMNPYERRIIHANLQDNEDVTTYSVGQEPHRRVVIAPKHPKPYKKRGYNKNRSDNKKNRASGSSGTRGGYSRPSYTKPERRPAEKSAPGSATYKADFKPTPHKPEYKDFAEYLAAQSKNN